jgi:hypothetical protein
MAEKYRYLLEKAVYNGELEVLEKLYSEKKITEEMVKCGNNCAFRNAARNGHLAVLRWLKSTFNITMESDASDIISAFNIAAECSKLLTIKWLYFNFSQARRPITVNSSVLESLCWKGRLDILKWLYSKACFTQKDIYSTNHYSIILAVEREHFDIFKWLYDTFYSTDETLELHENLFNLAAKTGQVKVLRCLPNSWKYNYNDLFLMGVKRSRFDILFYVEEKYNSQPFELAIEDSIYLDFSDACIIAAKTENFMVAEWLRDSFTCACLAMNKLKQIKYSASSRTVSWEK